MSGRPAEFMVNLSSIHEQLFLNIKSSFLSPSMTPYLLTTSIASRLSVTAVHNKSMSFVRITDDLSSYDTYIAIGNPVQTPHKFPSSALDLTSC